MSQTAAAAPPRRQESVSVAVDAGPLYGHRTGVGVAVAATLVALDARGDIELRPYVTSLRARVRPPERRLPIPAAVAHRVWSRQLPPAIDRVLTRWGTVDRWVGHPDVVHGMNYVVPPASCPRVVTVHDCWFLEHPGLAAPDVVRAGRVLTRAVADGAHVVAVSDATAAQVRELLGTDRVVRVWNGPPAPPLDPAPSTPARLAHLAEARFVLALGTIERRKNLPTLISAFSRVAREHETARLVIAGADGDDRPALDRAIAVLPEAAQRRIHQVGPVDHVEKEWLLRHARALAYPSLDEGFGFPILEAQQHGTPVVASTAGSIPEIAGPGALFSTPRDAEALAANLYWVLTNDQQHAALAARGRANLRRFSWTSTAEQLATLYRSLT